MVVTDTFWVTGRGVFILVKPPIPIAVGKTLRLIPPSGLLSYVATVRSCETLYDNFLQATSVNVQLEGFQSKPNLDGCKIEIL